MERTTFCSSSIISARGVALIFIIAVIDGVIGNDSDVLGVSVLMIARTSILSPVLSSCYHIHSPYKVLTDYLLNHCSY